jgi:lipopolysaccharide transport system ATP-binding protein
MSSEDIAIDVSNVGKRYEIYQAPRDRLKQMILPRMHGWLAHGSLRRGLVRPQYFRDFWALHDVSFQVRKGESVGVIGRNGSGKSTLLQIVAGTMSPSTGRAVTNGRIAALLELGSGFNPEFTGRENVYLNCMILGLSREEVDARMDDILAFADIGDFVDQAVKTYSSGMFLRLAFAVQAHIDAGVVLIDEALAVGDVFFRQKCYARLNQLRSAGAAILLVTHSMPDIEQLCDRAILLDRGTLRFVGNSSEASKRYYLLHQEKIAIPAPGGAAAKEIKPDSPNPAAAIEHPALEALLDISGVPQVTDGRARCVAVALCDAEGNPCNAFHQGDVAVFYYEFVLLEEIGVPIGGVLFSNERGVIVHGKNCWQGVHSVPPTPSAGARLLYRQEIKLDVALGEYTFEVGLAAVAATTWARRAEISHEAMNGLHVRVCHLPAVGSFSVGYALSVNGVPFLTHHGIADLPGKVSATAYMPAES